MHPRLSVSALSSWSLSFDDDLRLWDELGIGAVGLFFDKLKAAGLESAVGRVAAAGLQVSSVGCRGFDLDDPASWPKRRHVLNTAVDAATALSAGCLFVTAGAPGALDWSGGVAALDAALAPVRERARERGVALAIEHTSPLRRDVGFIHTLADMVEVARDLDVGVVVELTNCWSERDVERTMSDGVDTFRLVQASDYVVGTLTASERAVPGDGDIPLGRLLARLHEAGYRGWVELEMLGARIEAEGYGPAIARAVSALETLLPPASA
jgi:sugar phosphate isomerase/epimerase